MAHSQCLILTQLTLLKITGLWPARIKQLEPKKIVHIIFIVHSILMLVLSFYHTKMKVHAALNSSKSTKSLTTDFVSISQTVAEFLTKLTIWEIAIFRYSTISQYFLSSGQRCLNTSHLFLTLFVTGVHQGIILWSTYWAAKFYFSNMPFTLFFFKDITFTGTDAETHFYAAVDVIIFGLKSFHILTAFILGHCVALSEELQEIVKILTKEISGEHIYQEKENILKVLKTKYTIICNLCSSVDHTFRYYIMFLTVSLGIGIFSSIYFQSIVTCLDQNKANFYVYLFLQFLSFFYLCLGGSLIHDSVSTCGLQVLFCRYSCVAQFPARKHLTQKDFFCESHVFDRNNTLRTHGQFKSESCALKCFSVRKSGPTVCGGLSTNEQKAVTCNSNALGDRSAVSVKTQQEERSHS